jgi:hypothetical protein
MDVITAAHARDTRMSDCIFVCAHRKLRREKRGAGHVSINHAVALGHREKSPTPLLIVAIPGGRPGWA